MARLLPNYFGFKVRGSFYIFLIILRAKYGYDEHLAEQNEDYITNFSILQSILLLLIPIIQGERKKLVNFSFFSVFALKKMFVEKKVRV